jgi:hypothetical protein
MDRKLLGNYTKLQLFMNEQDVYNWLHEKQAPKVQEMGLGELLIYYLTRKSSGADKLNTGPSNLVNIITSDRLEELGVDISVLDTMSEDEIRTLAYKNLQQ